MLSFRFREIFVLFYRLGLVYLFYMFSRFVFYLSNRDALQVQFMEEFLSICYHGLLFDTSAILLTNALFILLSLLPFEKRVYSAFYQRTLFYIYFFVNILALAINYIDVIYYKFTGTRTTFVIFSELSNEKDKSALLFVFVKDYYYMFILFFLMIALWIWLYKRVSLRKNYLSPIRVLYYPISLFFILLAVLLAVFGIRGDFELSARPINLVDASRHINKIQHADMVLNTPFAIIRTIGKGGFAPLNYLSDEQIHQNLNNLRRYNRQIKEKPNVFIFILESFSREYIGAFNQESKIRDYKSYTPFLDSLSQHSLIFPNAHANGYKSIHGMSSILSGIPSFRTAFTSSPYVNQPIESVISTSNELGYRTLFFHGASNGSMGFLGFSKVLGMHAYYGRTEYNNENNYDGHWGIWDEPFFKYTAQVLDTVKKPFLSVLFSVSSHHPFKLPKAYENKFPKGTLPIHKTIGYTDHALKTFFESVKSKPWFENTLFIITADHTNQIYYDEYRKPMNSTAVPIIIYDPKERFRGKDTRFAQHIDIYPTIVDYIGYNKPFRSWGSSLLEGPTDAFVINYGNNIYRYMRGDYIFTFNEDKKEGFYHASDLGLTKNILGSGLPQEDSLRKRAYAFLQDYMRCVANRRLKTID